MKKYFLTGLAILLPVFVTLIIVGFLVNFLTKPFLGIVKSLLANIHFFHNEVLLTILSKLLILGFIFGITLLVGFLGQWFLIHYFFKSLDYIMHRIPLVKSVYKSAKEVVHSLFTSEKPSFSKVVLVPFPHSKALSIGLITQESETNVMNRKGLVSVLLPGTPNPMMGFMLLYKEEQVIPIDITVEQAMKILVSCGVMCNKD